jgi:3-hydroxyacyl-[acyl-carrier protein] dehydratase/trans-2-decenoyl-[acyl-carrier protein] isomerase
MVRYRVSLKRVLMRRVYMGIADGHVEVDDRTIYTGRNLRVGLFTNTSVETAK